MPKTIVIDTKKVHDIHALFLLFEQELGVDFWHNLDGLADVVDDSEVSIQISDREEFLRIFDEEATREYFGDRYTPDMPMLAEILLEIFQNRLLSE